MSEDKNRGYLPNPVPNSGRGLNINTSAPGRNYLGPGPESSHFRDQSIDTPEEGYNLQPMSFERDDSRARLNANADGYNIHPQTQTQPSSQSQSQGYDQSQNQPLHSTPPRVHYPPSPYIRQEYTTIPLNDSTSPNPSTQPLPVLHTYNSANSAPMSMNMSNSGRNSPNVGSGSGVNTPNGSSHGHGNGKRKPWSAFLNSTSQKSSPSSPTQESTSNGLGGGMGGGKVYADAGDKEKGYSSKPKRPRNQRGGSWDLLGDRPEWEEFNPAKASVDNLRFAEGDVGTNALSRFYYWAINRSIIFRWALYILPVMGLLWIPGILGVTAAKNGTVWFVHLIWWSIWLTVLWGGFWAATAVFLLFPAVWRNTAGALVPSARKYTDVIRALGRYAKLIFWMMAVWISFTPLVINHYTGPGGASSRSNLTTLANILFGLFLCTIILGVEKLIVQLIALQFHRDSYEDRLREQKFNVKCLTALYINSHDIPGRSDTLTDAQSSRTKASQMPKIAIRKALRGLREVAQTTTTALGNVASEMAGQSVLQTNSPANKVTAALASANKSKALARRLYYSFRQPGVDHILIGDIAGYFPDLETAEVAFQVFDKDGNGDVSRDEMESAILGMHRERLSLEASMRDLDGAVRRLDQIFLVIVVFIAVLILAATITTKLTALVTSAGTFILGLSWLIGSTMQEILLACIFLFVKHPYDVGDRVDFDGNAYTVVKMQLMSTSFKRVDGKYVWVGHNILATKVIENIRRSGPTSETFVFEVAFDTTFESLQILREKMLKFVKDNSRDFLPIFDVIVDDIPAQGKMVLKADIKYKSNWQQGALKVQRRNKWICALKMTLADLKIWGPGGAGNPNPDPAEPTKYTLIPYEEAVAAAPAAGQPDSPPPNFQTATSASVSNQASRLTDRREVVNDPSQDIWGEGDEYGPDTALPSRAGTPGTPMSAGGELRARHPPVPGERLEQTARRL